MEMIDFRKYQGLGNDFIVIDARKYSANTVSKFKRIDNKLIRKLCDRNFGIGADGLIIAFDPIENGDILMKIYNSDGSEAEMCGNGIRCLIKCLMDSNDKQINNNLVVETKAGYIQASIKDSQITVNMGCPITDPTKIPTLLQIGKHGIPHGKLTLGEKQINLYSVGMGNPHAIIHVEDLTKVPLSTWGPLLEKHELFPSNTNVHFVEVINREYLKMIVWERGCGPTLACGTGACASLVVTAFIGMCDYTTEVELPGGSLHVSCKSLVSPVFMTGPAKFIFSGQIKIVSL